MDYDTCVAYFRNGLSPQQAASVRAWLAAHPDDARRARIDAEHERALARTLDGVLQEPLPPHLQITPRSGINPWARRAALAAAIVLSAAAGWWLGGSPGMRDSATTFTQRVVAAAQQTVASNALQTDTHQPVPVQAPDLSMRGYRLVQQRRLNNAEPVLIEFVYRNGRGQWLRIYAETATARHDGTPSLTTRDGVSLAQWRAGGTRYALVGDLPGFLLQTLAHAAQTHTISGETTLVGAGSWRDETLATVKGEAALQPSGAPSHEQAVPAVTEDGYTVQPARM